MSFSIWENKNKGGNGKQILVDENRNSKDVTNTNPTFKFTPLTNENKQINSLLPSTWFTEKKKFNSREYTSFQIPFRKQRKKVGAFLKKKFLSVEPRFESKQSKGSKQAKRAHVMTRGRGVTGTTKGKRGKCLCSLCILITSDFISCSLSLSTIKK